MASHNYWNIHVSHLDRNKGIPIEGVGDTLLISYNSSDNPSKSYFVIIFVKEYLSPESYTDKFYTAWSFFENPKRPAIASEYKEKILGVFKNDELTEISDDIIDSKLYSLKRKNDKAIGYLVFRKARRQVEKAKEMFAVDVTSVKNSIQLLRQNPGYLEWQEACFRAVKNNSKALLLRRYVIDVKHEDSIDNFIWILQEYFNQFQTNKEELPDRIQIFYHKNNDIEKAINELDDNKVNELIDKLQVLIQELSSKDKIVKLLMDNREKQRDLLKKLVIRDFIVTDNIIYDFITPSGKVDLTGKNDFVFVQRDKNENFDHLEGQYRIIKDFLSTYCRSIPVRKLDKKRIREELKNNISGNE